MRTIVEEQLAPAHRIETKAVQADGAGFMHDDGIFVGKLGDLIGQPIGEQWRFDTNLRYYTQRDDNGDKQSRFSPSLKVAYQLRNSYYLESEVGPETSHNTGIDRDDKIVRDYWYFGLRWDFR